MGEEDILQDEGEVGQGKLLLSGPKATSEWSLLTKLKSG